MVLGNTFFSILRTRSYLKSFSILSLLLLTSLFAPSFSHGATKTIHAEWNYTKPSGVDLSGFRLYDKATGKKVCETNDPSARSLDCTADVTANTMNFTMTAFNATMESPQSTAFTVSVPSDTNSSNPAAGIIVDNGGTGTSSVGIWEVSGGVNPYGSSSLYCSQSGGTYTFTTSVKGSVEIAVWWTEYSNRETSVPIKVYDANQLIDTITVNQTVNGGKWNVLGTYKITNQAKIAIVSTGSGTTCADAVHFKQVSPPVSVADKTPPSVTPPADKTVDATGLLTSVNLGSAIATDNIDGKVSAHPSDTGPFTAGRHTITWTARDASGNVGKATQTININPLVNFGPDQATGRKGKVNVRVYLNGNACKYPVKIPYTVHGTARISKDHNASAGTITISSGREASITFDVFENKESKKDETIIFTLGNPINATLGPKPTHIVTVTKKNVAPRVRLEAIQNSNATKAVAKDLGNVSVVAYIDDPNPVDSHTANWEVSGNYIIPVDNSTLEPFVDANSGKTVAVFTFNPSKISDKLITLKIHITDNGSPAKTTTAELLLQNIGLAPNLTNSDSDGDGISDAAEGFGDSDYDGILDHLDAISDEELLQTRQTNDYKWLMETEAGLTLHLGSVALSAVKSVAVVSEDEIALYEGDGGNVTTDAIDSLADPSNIFDFEISGLPQSGQSVKVVLPLSEPIPQNAVYRKCVSTEGWFDFAIDARNAVASASGAPGVCPPPGDALYTNGLTAGDNCVQLTIEDGGPNDADHDANGIIKDPSGVGVVEGSSSASFLGDSAAASSSGGGGGGGCTLNRQEDKLDPTLCLLCLGSLVYLARGRRYNTRSGKDQRQ